MKFMKKLQSCILKIHKYCELNIGTVIEPKWILYCEYCGDIIQVTK
jgi:hypothetical protein